MIILLEIIANKNKRFKLTIIGYTKLVPKVISFLTFVCIFYGFFGIMLAKTYSNSFWSCVNQATGSQVRDKADCLNWGGDWV